MLGSAAAGATIGAPVGAIAGAKVGAVYGAIHGVRLANAVIATKQNLLHNSLDVARALIVDPIVMSAGLKVAVCEYCAHSDIFSHACLPSFTVVCKESYYFW